MDGNLQVAYDVSVNFVSAWNEMFVQNDFVNAFTGKIDPRHMYGTSNFDVFRWNSLNNGTQRSVLGTFIATLLMPGIPLVRMRSTLLRRILYISAQLYYGEEQNLYLYDNTANNYLFGCVLVVFSSKCFTDVQFRRQSMTATKAWQRHGCYHLGSNSFYNMDLGKSVAGCHDDWNSLDHFDPTTDSRRIFAQMFYLRSVYPALQDGWNLVQWGNWTYQDQLPGSNGTMTEKGLWSTSRSALTPWQNFTGNTGGQVWLLFTNVNETTTWTEDCSGPLWISSPFQAGTVVRNLFHPYENYTLAPSLSPYYHDGKAPYYGCMSSITLAPMGFKALVTAEQWVPPPPVITKFNPGHDARIEVQEGSQNRTTVALRFEFSQPMDCDSVTQSMTFNMSSSGHGGSPAIVQGSVNCLTMNPGDVPPAAIPGVTISAWYWTGTLSNVADGILTVTIKDPKSQSGASTGVSCLSFISGRVSST